MASFDTSGLTNNVGYSSEFVNSTADLSKAQAITNAGNLASGIAKSAMGVAEEFDKVEGKNIATEAVNKEIDSLITGAQEDGQQKGFAVTDESVTKEEVDYQKNIDNKFKNVENANKSKGSQFGYTKIQSLKVKLLSEEKDPKKAAIIRKVFDERYPSLDNKVVDEEVKRIEKEEKIAEEENKLKEKASYLGISLDDLKKRDVVLEDKKAKVEIAKADELLGLDSKDPKSATKLYDLYTTEAELKVHQLNGVFINDKNFGKATDFDAVSQQIEQARLNAIAKINKSFEGIVDVNGKKDKAITAVNATYSAAIGNAKLFTSTALNEAEKKRLLSYQELENVINTPFMLQNPERFNQLVDLHNKIKDNNGFAGAFPKARESITSSIEKSFNAKNIQGSSVIEQKSANNDVRDILTSNPYIDENKKVTIGMDEDGNITNPNQLIADTVSHFIEVVKDKAKSFFSPVINAATGKEFTPNTKLAEDLSKDYLMKANSSEDWNDGVEFVKKVDEESEKPRNKMQTISVVISKNRSFPTYANSNDLTKEIVSNDFNDVTNFSFNKLAELKNNDPTLELFYDEDAKKFIMAKPTQTINFLPSARYLESNANTEQVKSSLNKNEYNTTSYGVKIINNKNRNTVSQLTDQAGQNHPMMENFNEQMNFLAIKEWSNHLSKTNNGKLDQITYVKGLINYINNIYPESVKANQENLKIKEAAIKNSEAKQRNDILRAGAFIPNSELTPEQLKIRQELNPEITKEVNERLKNNLNKVMAGLDLQSLDAESLKKLIEENVINI